VTIFVLTVLRPPLEKRTPGWYPDLETAKEVIEGNTCEVHEYCYHFAVIEEVLPGLYPECCNAWWYEWVDDAYKQIKKPSCYKKMVNFGIG